MGNKEAEEKSLWEVGKHDLRKIQKYNVLMRGK